MVTNSQPIVANIAHSIQTHLICNLAPQMSTLYHLNAPHYAPKYRLNGDVDCILRVDSQVSPTPHARLPI